MTHQEPGPSVIASTSCRDGEAPPEGLLSIVGDTAMTMESWSNAEAMEARSNIEVQSATSTSCTSLGNK